MINPSRVFVTKSNTVYISGENQNKIEVWTDGTSSPIRNISTGYVFCVSDNQDVYVHNFPQAQVERWQQNGTSHNLVMFISSQCNDLFIDTNNSLYCAHDEFNIVVSKSLNDPTNAFKTVAGTGCYGSQSDALNRPAAVFVDLEFQLYIADSLNNRIQRFRPGERNGTTVAGSPATAILTNPTDVVLDSDGNLYIVDCNMNRIVRSGVSGFWCIAGCTNAQGSTPYQLNTPKAMSFDSYGNIFVADFNVSRVQKFFLSTGSCGKSHLIWSRTKYMCDGRFRCFLYSLRQLKTLSPSID